MSVLQLYDMRRERCICLFLISEFHLQHVILFVSSIYSRNAMSHMDVVIKNYGLHYKRSKTSLKKMNQKYYIPQFFLLLMWTLINSNNNFTQDTNFNISKSHKKNKSKLYLDVGVRNTCAHITNISTIQIFTHVISS